jgi:small subunit ribosomal protein S13
MLIIFGVKLIQDKKVMYALPQLYGLGISLSKKICKELNFAPELTIRHLTVKQQFEIAKKIKEEFRVEENLKEIVKNNIQRYILSGSVRGYRHKNNLPVRGQRTHTNAKTAAKGLSFLTKKVLK